MIVPSKGKNFKVKMYGKNKDYISLESFGFVSKLGKVKQDQKEVNYGRKCQNT